MKRCCIPSCLDNHHARGYCQRHYQRLLRQGTATRQRGASLLAIVRELERTNGEMMPLCELAPRVHLSPQSVTVYISRIRQRFGFTCIEGSPSRGYRLGEWPGREPYYQRPPKRTPVRIARAPEYDSSAGVVITEAGRRLGLS